MTRYNFALNNLLGAVYKQGNITFTPDGNCLLSPVGNKITCFDLVNNSSFTFPFENIKNIKCIDISADGNFIISIDEDGRAIIANYHKRTIIYRISFKSKVSAVKFSPCGRFIAVGIHHKYQVQIWKTPLFIRNEQLNNDDDLEIDFAPFSLHHTHTGHQDDISSFTWSHNSSLLLSCSKDMTLRLWTVSQVDGYKPIVISGHRDVVVGAWWNTEMTELYSIARDGSLYIWQSFNEQENIVPFVPVECNVSLSQKHIFNQKSEHGIAQTRCASYHPENNLLIVGFSNGVFSIYELPDFNLIHSLNISQKKIDSVTISKSGEWIGFASSALGQLLVWEWKSESYILKQQGHFYDMNCAAYSSNGQFIATGGDDGKVKIWNSSNGFCFVTFSEHSAPVTAIKFAGKNGGKQSVVFSASLDGTVRAFDLVRYRNFRTFTAPNNVQFSCLAVDPAGEIICAGSLDSFDIFVWSVQTGQLIEVLSGHEGPISSLAFSQETTSSSNMQGTILASGSWDHSVKIWDLFSRGETSKCMETFKHKSDVIAVALKPDGKELCVSTLDGQLSFWDPHNGAHSQRINIIEGRRDIAGGRKQTDLRTTQNNTADKYFTSITYTADGSALLAGGNSKWVCLYDIENHVLLKKYQLSRNLSLDGVLDKLNSKNVTEGGVVDINDSGDEPSDIDERVSIRKTLPGASKNDRSSRRILPEIRCKCIEFSPSGSNWIAATTEGLVEYGVADSQIFDPVDLDIELTPDNIVKIVKRLQSGRQNENESWLVALIMALRLNEIGLLQMVYESIPVGELKFVASNMPQKYLIHVLRLIALLLDSRNESIQGQNSSFVQLYQKSPHIQFHLQFMTQLIFTHGNYLKSATHNSILPALNQIQSNQGVRMSSNISVILRSIKKHLTQLQSDVNQLSQSNLYLVETLRTMAYDEQDQMIEV